MTLFRVAFLPAAEKELAKLPRPAQVKLAAIIRALAGNPTPAGCKAVTGYKGHYRVRSGDFRVVYEVQGGLLLVLVVAVGNRKDIYERLKRRLG